MKGARLLIPFTPPLSLTLFLTHALLFPFRPYFNLLLFLKAQRQLALTFDLLNSGMTLPQFFFGLAKTIHKLNYKAVKKYHTIVFKYTSKRA